MNKSNYQVRLEKFEGPLDLLLHLIEKSEIDIYDIPIAQITDQYLYYINEAKSLDLDFLSEFLVMAATLLTIKAKMLLPKEKKVSEEEEIDPREELVTRLLEYKQYKEVANLLKEKEVNMSQVFTRIIDESQLIKEFGPQNPVENISINDLVKAFQVVLEKANTPEPVIELQREEVSLQECMVYVLESLETNASGLLFSELFPPGTSRTRIIVTFLALLELIKLNKIRFRQSNIFGKLYIFLKE